MKSKYWIKLYHEILDDPKMGRLSDRLYRRTIEMFLLAGDYDQAGFLPSLEDIAWRLHLEPEQLETDLIELQRIGILDVIDGRWYVAKFAERQAADSDTERWKRWKERQHKALGSVPADPPPPHNAYTNYQHDTNDMLVEEDIDLEVEVDTESEAAVEAAAAGAAGPPNSQKNTHLKSPKHDQRHQEELDLLHKAGIFEPTASEIVTYPHIDLAYLTAHITRAVQEGIAPGLLVTRLRNNDPPPISAVEQNALERERYADALRQLQR